MIKELIKIANELDSRGLSSEADIVDEIIRDHEKTLSSIVGKFKEDVNALIPNASNSKLDTMIKSASITFSLDTDEWIKKKSHCHSCLDIKSKQEDTKKVLEEFNTDSPNPKAWAQAWAKEHQERNEAVNIDMYFYDTMRRLKEAQETLERYPLNKKPIDLCKETLGDNFFYSISEWEYYHESDEEGIGYKLESSPPGDTMNLSNRNARKILDIIGVHPDPEYPDSYYISKDDVANVISRIIRILNIEGATDKYTEESTITQDDRGTKIITNKDGIPEIKRDLGPTVITGGVDKEYIEEKLNILLNILIQAKEAELGVIAL
tara:strand:- start:2080 stop:3042 length:963 start_codon:yes stop_codon:yes gene_type:complete